METTTTLKSVAKMTVNEVVINYEYERAEGQLPSRIAVNGVRNVQTPTGPRVAVINANYSVSEKTLNLSGSNIELADIAVISAIVGGINELLTSLESEA